MSFRNMLTVVDRLLNTVEYRVAQRDVATRQRRQHVEMKLTEESTLPTTSTTILTNIPSSTRNRMARRAANLSTEEYDRLLEAVDADDVDTLRDLLDKTKTQIEKEKSTENTERVFYKVISILLGLVHLPIVD